MIINLKFMRARSFDTINDVMALIDDAPRAKVDLMHKRWRGNIAHVVPISRETLIRGKIESSLFSYWTTSWLFLWPQPQYMW
jgi:hypothetical protein